MAKYNRKDNEGHRFNVPAELLIRFDELFDAYCRAKRFSDEYYDLETQFCNEFEQYMIG